MIKHLAPIALLFIVSNASANINDIVALKAAENSVDEKLVHAVIKAESAYNPRAISPVGAAGLMQLMPDTAKRFGVVDRYDPEQNISGGTKYLRFLLDTFGDVKLAVAAYNAGENAVIKYGNKVPPYPETQNYVNKVLENYNDKSDKQAVVDNKQPKKDSPYSENVFFIDPAAASW
jgi:soluble lytic murein transglycosylase-like protein